MGTRPGGKLPAGRGVTLDGDCDLVEFEPEHIVQQKRRPLQWRQALQRKHQRQGHIFRFLLLDDGVGKPGTHIGFALVLC